MKNLWIILSDFFFPPENREPVEYVADDSKTRRLNILFSIVLIICILVLSYLLVVLLR